MPKITAGSLDEHRSQVHQQVFDSFAALMATKSFDAISMAQIAAGAGLGRTAIYHHFGDKEAVVVAFASHETNRYLDRLAEVLAESDRPVERMRIYIRHHIVAGEQFHMGLGPQLYAALSPGSLQQIREHVIAVERVLRDLLTSGIESGDFTVTDVDATMSLLHACLGPRHLPSDIVEEFVLRALGVPA